MSITLDTASCAKAQTDADVHLMPCEIEHDGEANVDDYLLPTVKDDGNGYLTAAFRGRPLKGEKYILPEGYTGIMTHEPRRPFVEDEERTFKISHQFNEFMYWNLDIPPNADDKLRKAMAWIDVAKAIHRPVDEIGSQKSLTGK
ncbi:ribonuclease H2 subunit C-like [Lineus longissimus]|uniref:ribonuclease H2 subunit C-like n=1 Tax=Lineus longissimus TaxID=88925 RepID=UPI002B4EA081